MPKDFKKSNYFRTVFIRIDFAYCLEYEKIIILPKIVDIPWVHYRFYAVAVKQLSSDK